LGKPAEMKAGVAGLSGPLADRAFDRAKGPA
jgi:hypothetical protein